MPFFVVMIVALIIGGLSSAGYCAILGRWTLRDWIALAIALAIALSLSFAALAAAGAVRIAS